MKKKILVITYDYVPYATPNTFRWQNILSYWTANFNCEIHVVTPSRNFEPEYELLDGIHIHRTPMSSSLKVKREGSNDGNLIDGKYKTSLKVKLLRFINVYIWSKLYWPDFAFLWYRPGYKLSKKIIAKHQISNVISVSWPFTDHLIAFSLRKEFDFNWLADTIDPFCYNEGINNYRIYRRINRYFEKKVFEMADCISVLTKNVKNEYVRVLKKFQEKIHINPNIYVQSSFLGEKQVTDKIKLVFIGTLDMHVRRPDFALELFSELNRFYPENNFEYHFYGNVSSCKHIFDKYVKEENNFYLHGVVEKKVAINQIFNADILVNIGNNNPFQEPSKLLDYIQARSKVLNICGIEEDSSLDILLQYPLNYNVFPKDIKNSQKYPEIIKFINGGESTDEELLKIKVNSILDRHSVKNVSTGYYNLLK